jgi:hypothetical protein
VHDSPGQPGVKPEPISKITKVQRARDLAKVVEHLFSKQEALSSNSNIEKKTVKKKKE